MPWKETDMMHQKLLLIADYDKQLYTMTELCERYGVSRKTGYKWVKRYQESGISGLNNQSRAPKSCPHKTPDSISDAILELKKKHPKWGAKKLLAILKKKEPETSWPAISTAQDLLRKNGLTHIRPKRRKTNHPFQKLPEVIAPNDVWATDFKGEFPTKDGKLCYPLTITDSYSRYIIGCQGLSGTGQKGAFGVFEQIFREYGLPKILLSDNGVPFASNAIHGLSQLNVWWLKLGIVPLRIMPGRPDQNGRHERMHRTLKAHTARPPEKNHQAQQIAFDTFRQEYNHVRPHESLGMQTPASFYKPCERIYTGEAPEVEYPGYFITRKVQTDGSILFQQKKVFLSRTLKGESVGMEEVDDGIWSIYFSTMLLGRYSEEKKRFFP